MIPNTTPTPNELYNGEMKKMSDVELRVVLIITRKTLGWEEDPITKMRKKEDWINRTQLMKLSGRSNRHVSKAIDSCIKNGWIEARDKDGNMLDTKDKRRRLGYGGKIYYRLGIKFLDRISAVTKGNCQKVTAQKVTGTKETGYNKRKLFTKGIKNYPHVDKPEKVGDIIKRKL